MCHGHACLTFVPRPCFFNFYATDILVKHLCYVLTFVPRPWLIHICSTAILDPYMFHGHAWSIYVPRPCLIHICATAMLDPYMFHGHAWSIYKPRPCLIHTCSTAAMLDPYMCHDHACRLLPVNCTLKTNSGSTLSALNITAPFQEGLKLWGGMQKTGKFKKKKKKLFSQKNLFIVKLLSRTCS